MNVAKPLKLYTVEEFELSVEKLKDSLYSPPDTGG